MAAYGCGYRSVSLASFYRRLSYLMLHDGLFEARAAHGDVSRLLIPAPSRRSVWGLHLSLLFTARL